MNPTETIERSAWAKVNLALSVGPANDSGMHPICSWMACVDLCDRIRISRLSDGDPSVFDLGWEDGSPVGWDAADDLIVRAHTLMERECGRALPVRIELLKTIPDGGGLGGGSSNAGAVMLALDERFGLGLGLERLRKLSAHLGSDVAFFIDDQSPPRAAIVSGLGDRIERVGPVSGEVTLVCPPFGCPTGAVYLAYDEAPGELRERDVRDMALLTPDPERMFNDLAPPAERVEPRLADLRSFLQGVLGHSVHVSGSGSTLLVIGPEGASERARLAAPSCRVIPTRFV